MSRYSFNPKLDPGRNRRRRMLLGTAVFAAVLILGIVLFIIGIRSLTSGGGGGGDSSGGSQSATPTRFVPAVTIYAPGGGADTPAATGASTSATPADTAATAAPGSAQATPADATATPAATQAAPASTMDPAGALPGVPDFTCLSPHAAPNTLGYGIQSNWAVGDIGYWNSVMAEKLKVNWTKAQIRWNDFEPEQGNINVMQWQLLDAFTNDANKKGLNIVFGILSTPGWARSVKEREGPPDDYNEAVRFASKVIARYKGCVQAVEIWNEMNLDREWTIPTGKIAAADYIKFLQAVVPPLRKIDPNLMIVMGALSPTGSSDPGKYMDDFEYMDQFVAGGGPQLVDCIGVHLNGFNLPPDKEFNAGYNDPTAQFRGPFDNPVHSWSFLSTLKGYYQRTQKPMCVTEFGWASMENLGTTGAPEGFGFALDNSEQEQADWIIQAFQIMRDSGFVRFGIVFNLDYIKKDGQPVNQDPNAPYSVIRPDGSTRPAFDAIERMPKQ